MKNIKTIALHDNTFQLLDTLKKSEAAPSFDSLIAQLVKEKMKVPKSMFGSLKGKAKKFTPKERKNMWKDNV